MPDKIAMFVAKHPWWSALIVSLIIGALVSSWAPQLGGPLLLAAWVAIPIWRASTLSKHPELRLVQKSPIAPVQTLRVGRPPKLVRVQYRSEGDRRPLFDRPRTYTFLWPFNEPVIPGTWVSVPGGDGASCGVIVEPGQPDDYDGKYKQVLRVLTSVPPVETINSAHHPPTSLTARGLEPWGRPATQVEVAFEALHRKEVAELFRMRNVPITMIGQEMAVEVVLSQSRGRYPAVVVEGHWIGNILEEAAGHLRSELAKLAGVGQGLLLPGRLWAMDDGGVIRSRLSLKLPSPGEILPPGPMPHGAHVVLPHGAAIQVTKEEEHLNELVAILDGRNEIPVVAQLYAFDHALARSSRTVVGVSVYGDHVGQLTPASSAHFLPLLEACDEEGVAVVCRAVAKGNNLKADVVLYASRAGELSNEWIEQHIYAARENLGWHAGTEAAPQRTRPQGMWTDDDLSEGGASR